MLYLDYTRSEKWIEMKPLKRKESLGYKIKSLTGIIPEIRSVID